MYMYMYMYHTHLLYSACTQSKYIICVVPTVYMYAQDPVVCCCVLANAQRQTTRVSRASGRLMIHLHVQIYMYIG